jgi:hypothetical protein
MMTALGLYILSWSALASFSRHEHLQPNHQVRIWILSAGHSSLVVWPRASSPSLLPSLFDNQQNRSARRRHHPTMLQPIFRPSHPNPCWPIVHFFGHRLRELVVDVEDSCIPESAGADAAVDSRWVWSPWGRGITINPIFSSWLRSILFLIPFTLCVVGRWFGAQERWWLHLSVFIGCPCGPFWQKCTSPIKRYHADPAWHRKSDPQAKMIL